MSIDENTSQELTNPTPVTTAPTVGSQPTVMTDEEIAKLEPASNTGTVSMDDNLKGRVVLENGTELLFTRNESSTLYIATLQELHRTLQVPEPLPTQIIFPEQDKEDLDFIAKYIGGVRNIMDVVHEHGCSSSIESYSFRLAHFHNFEKWQNIVVRLQFAKALHAVCKTLNENLSTARKKKWGVLEYDRASNKYSINGKELKFGDKVDVFTTDQKVVTKMVFNSHEVLNCAAIDGHTSPIFHHPTEDLDNLDYEAVGKRNSHRVSDTEHMLGVDAFSFIHGLLWRQSDNEEVVEIESSILTQTDRDPALSVKEYDDILNAIDDMQLPYGLELPANVGFKNYYSKRLSRARAFFEMLKTVKDNAKTFRRKFEKLTKDKPEMIIGIYDIFRLLAGPRSRVLKIKGVKADGSIVDLITINRNMTLEKFKTFNRFNTQPIHFVELEFIKPKGKKKNGKSKPELDLDYFKSTGEVVSSNDLVGFIHSSAKIYYWDDAETPRKEDPVDSKNIVALFLELKRSFARLDREEP